MQVHCALMGIYSQQLSALHSVAQRHIPLISISDVAGNSGGRTVAWEAYSLLYLETDTLITKALDSSISC